MVPKHSTSSIVVHDINNKDGRVIISNHNVKITETNINSTQTLSFAEVYRHIDSHLEISVNEKTDLKAEVAEVEAALKKPEKVNENMVVRHLHNIGRMAPDILEVVLAAICSPTAGLGEVARKIAAKAREK